MAYLSMQKVLEELSTSGKALFTLNDAAKVTGKNKRYLSRLFSTSKKVGHLERGKYYIKGADTYVLASNVLFPSYVSLLSAFRFYDLTTQMPVRIAIMTSRRHKEMEINDMKVDFITLGAKRIFGYRRIKGVFVATIEKTIVDSLYLMDPPNLYIEEAFGNAKDKIDLDRLAYYARRMKSAALMKRLEKLLKSFGIVESIAISPKKKKVYD